MLDEFQREEGLRHFYRGLALERANRVVEAVEEYRRAIATYPYLREAHDALGLYYQRNGLLAKAADEFHIVANLEGDFLSYFNLGYVLVELERYEEALEAFQRCLQLEPDDSATHYEIGFIHFSQGEFRAALDHLQRPLHSYPEDWEVHNLLGKCYLGLRRYDEALAGFGHALMLARTTAAQAELIDNIATVERHREFRNLNSTKDQLYAQDGVVYLGSAQDDGLKAAEVQDYHFTYPDIGTTIQRLIALCQSYRWHFSVVVAVDKLAEPLASALSQLLNLPLRPIADLRDDDSALLVLAVAREAELLLLTIERAPCSTIAFCLGLNWLRHSRIFPELIGIAARGSCTVPWEPELRRLRADGAPQDQLATCITNATRQILQAVQETPLDTNLPSQVRYYTRKHRRLNFPLLMHEQITP
jgi:tetratricopeptide (TPR) repeat protein